MIHVIPSVASNWFELGVVLLDPKYQNELSTIETDSRNDARTCCRKMLVRWLNTDELASWDKLIKALRIIQLNDLASNIEQLLLQGEYATELCTLTLLLMYRPQKSGVMHITSYIILIHN